MIHPFRDGNGRMARALQTLVLAQGELADPTFSSIEEWLDHNTEDYCRVLAATGRGAWSPENDAHLWVKFNLRAHHMQAQTLQRRVAEADQLGRTVLDLLNETGLPERAFDPLFDAAIGARVRRPSYVKRSGVEAPDRDPRPQRAGRRWAAPVTWRHPRPLLPRRRADQGAAPRDPPPSAGPRRSLPVAGRRDRVAGTASWRVHVLMSKSQRTGPLLSMSVIGERPSDSQDDQVQRPAAVLRTPGRCASWWRRGPCAALARPRCRCPRSPSRSAEYAALGRR